MFESFNNFQLFSTPSSDGGPTSSPTSAAALASALAARGAEADPEADDEHDDEDGGEDGDAAGPPDGRHLAGDGGAQVVEVVLHPLEGDHFGPLPFSLSFEFANLVCFRGGDNGAPATFSTPSFTDSAIVYTHCAATFTATAMMMMMRRNRHLFLLRPFSAFSTSGTGGKNETSRNQPTNRASLARF